MIETLHFPSVKSFSLGKNNLPRQTKDNDGKESADELEPNENVVRCGREVRNPLFLLLVLSLSFSLSFSHSAHKTTHKSLLSTDFFNLSLVRACSFGFGGYSGSAAIGTSDSSGTQRGGGGGGVRFTSDGGGADMADQFSSSSFGEDDGSGKQSDGEKLARAIGLAAKPNQQSKKKGLEQMVEMLSEERENAQEFEIIASNALPMWTRVHSKCLRSEKSGGTTSTTNTDEARLLSVKAHCLMCERSGKRLAKCIGTTSAIPLILLARCDVDKNVAKEAESGFRRIFTTKERRAKALRFVAVDFLELVQESVQRAMAEFGGGNMKNNGGFSGSGKERDVIERDACASVRAIGQYVVDVFGFDEFREGEVVLRTTTTSEEADENEKNTKTTVKIALESALESLEYLRKVMTVESSTSLRVASLDCLRKLFLDKCETESGDDITTTIKQPITFAAFCEERTAKNVLENIFSRIEKEDDSYCLIRAWELVAGLSHAQWGAKNLTAWEVLPELSRTVIDGKIVRGFANAFEGAAVGCAPCVLPLFASLSLAQSTGEEGDAECLRNTISIVDAALQGAGDCEQFQSKNAEADAIAKASMECSLFALLRWLREDEKKETLLKTLLVEKWTPRAIEARNGIDNITTRWTDVSAKTIASLGSKPTAFSQRVVMAALESLGDFFIVSYDENPSRGAGICEQFKAIVLELTNKGALVPKEVHEKMRELMKRFASAIKNHEEKQGGTDDTFLALAIETLSPDSFGGADEVASFIGRVTINRKQKRETTSSRENDTTGAVDTTSIESLFAALKFASAETWSKHCEHILKTQKLEVALPHILSLLKRFVAESKQQDLKCAVIDDAFVRACENIVIESENGGSMTPSSQAFEAEIDFVKAFAGKTALIRLALNVDAYKKGLSSLSQSVEEKSSSQPIPRNILCDFSWPPPPEVKDEAILNFWAEKVVAVTFTNRCKDIIASNADVFDSFVGLEEADSDVDDDDEDEEGVAHDFSRLCDLARGDSSWYAFLCSSHMDMKKANDSNDESFAPVKKQVAKFIAQTIVRDGDVVSLNVRTKFAHTVLCGCFEVTNDVFANTFLEMSEKISDSAEFAYAIASALGSWHELVDAYVKNNASSGNDLVSCARVVISTMTALAPKHDGLLSAVAKRENLRDATLDALVENQNDELAWELVSLPSTSPADLTLAKKILVSYGFIWKNDESVCAYPHDESTLKTALSFDSCSKKTRILAHVVPKLLHRGEWMDVFLRCLVERIEKYYKDRSLNIASQLFLPALRLFGYFVSDSYIPNATQRASKLRRSVQNRDRTETRADEIGTFALSVWRAVDTRAQSDKATAARLKALGGASNEEDEFHDASTDDDLAIENEIDSAKIHLAILSSAKIASELDEKTWMSIFESMIGWIDSFARSSRMYLGQVSQVVEGEVRLEVHGGLLVDRKFHLFELAAACLASIEKFPIAVATPHIPEDEDVEDHGLYYNAEMDEMNPMEDVCTDVDLDSLKSGGDVVAFASKSGEFGQNLAKSLARAKWPRIRRVLLAIALEPLINFGAALFEHIQSEESEDRAEIMKPVLREVSAALAPILGDGTEGIFASSTCCSLAMRRFEYFAGEMLPGSEVSASSLNPLYVLLDDNIRFTPRVAAYLAFVLLSSDDVVRAACFGIDCSFNDVSKIDAIVEKRYRESKLQEAAAKDNDDDVYDEEEEPEEQELLAKYGLRENLAAILKEEGHKSRIDDDEDDLDERVGGVANVDYAWSLVFRALSSSRVEVPRRAKLRLIQYIAKINSKISIVSNAFNRILNSAPFYELASLMTEDENDDEKEGKTSELSMTVCDYGNHAETIAAFAPAQHHFGALSNARAAENFPPRVFLALVGSFIEHFPSISRSAYRELDGKKAKKDFVNDLDFICENILRKAFLDREIADTERFQNLRSSFASENVSDALSVRYSEKMSAIVARYDIDESFMEISIDIPETFPLKPAEPRESKRVGVSERRSRFWLLSLKTMLSSGSGLLNDAEEEDYEIENDSSATATSTTRGSILIAILKWSKFVDKFFEGAEPCPICYQVLAKSNGRKPEATCRQCSNSYHGDCLMKWFTTSSKSTCPMCQCSWGSTH